MLLLFAITTVAVDLTIRLQDPSGRAVPDVAIRIDCTDGASHHLHSDETGTVTAANTTCIPTWIHANKSGYYSHLAGFSHRVTLQPNPRNLPSLAQAKTLGELRQAFLEDHAHQTVFYREKQLRPLLRQLFQDLNFGSKAAQFLAIIAEPADLQQMLKLPQLRSHREIPWRYALASALIALPNNPAAQDFLHRANQGDFQDNWTQFCAKQTLKLQRLNLSGPDLVALAERAAKALEIGEWQRNGPPLMNQTKDKAIIEMTFTAGSDMLIYTATFHKNTGVWSLRAARETMQMLMPPLLPPALPQAPVLPPPTAPYTPPAALRYPRPGDVP